MNPEKQRIAIAEACGWRIEILDGSTFVYRPGAVAGNGYAFPDVNHPKIIAMLPDYLFDLNAMHEAEKILSYRQRQQYRECLFNLPASECDGTTFATAAQRARAFLRTIGKWEESE